MAINLSIGINSVLTSQHNATADIDTILNKVHALNTSIDSKLLPYNPWVKLDAILKESNWHDTHPTSNTRQLTQAKFEAEHYSGPRQGLNRKL
jgi:hypothetical protein